MNSEQLRDALRPFLSDGELGISIYAFIKGEESNGPKKLDIESDALPGLREMFLKRIEEDIIEKPELTVMNLSDSDERRSVIYEYDLARPEELNSLHAITRTDDVELLSLSNASLSNIKALVIEIGNNVGQLVLYKTMAPINIFGRDRIFLKKHEHRLSRIDDEFLRVSSGFQMLQIQNVLMVLDLGTLEKQFGFHDIVRREASASLDTIEGMELLENPETLRELVEDIRFARKLTKVSRSSPVIQRGISNEAIIQFCQEFPSLMSKIKVNEAGDKLFLDTQVSKNLFIKLLMDDYLVSELTSLHYESLAKDSAESEG